MTGEQVERPEEAEDWDEGRIVTVPVAMTEVDRVAPEKGTCPRSRRVDGLHSLRWDGDDPRTICEFCGEIRDALSGCLFRTDEVNP